MLQLHFKEIPWLKQSEKSEGSKTQKIPLLSNFLGHDEILREFSKNDKRTTLWFCWRTLNSRRCKFYKLQNTKDYKVYTQGN